MKYDFKLDLSVENNSHTQIVRRIPRGSRVLELGCATGYMSRYLRDELGCEVWGVEIDHAMATRAGEACERVIAGDVQQDHWLKPLNDEQFDIITCADILEHLRDPIALMKKLPPLLAEGGKLLASLPNGAHGALRLELLEGRFTYEDTGLLDRTHLHLFTHHSLREMFSRAGFVIDELSYTFHDLANDVIRERMQRMGFEVSGRGLAQFHTPEAAAFQFIVSATPSAEADKSLFPALTDKPMQDSMEVYRQLHAAMHETGETAATRLRMIEERDEILRNQQLELERLQQVLAERDRAVNQIQHELKHHADDLRRIRNSTGWRLWLLLMLPLRAARKAVPYLKHLIENPKFGLVWVKRHWRLWRIGGLKALTGQINQIELLSTMSPTLRYSLWIENVEPLGLSAPATEKELNESAGAPLISILMPVYNVAESWLRTALDSVLAQGYQHWELCIADDASTKPHVRKVLDEYALRDSRIRVVYREVNGHISAASNSALGIARGDFVGLMDHDDRLALHALFFVAQEIILHPDAGIIYSDEDKLNEEQVRFAHYFKPDFNPDLMRSHNMICHFGVYRHSLLKRVGGFRKAYEGAQDYDLALRCLREIEPAQVRHIPWVLYHWRAIPESTASGCDAKSYALHAAIRAMEDDLKVRGVAAEVTESDRIEGMLRVRYPVPEAPPLVSIIIPTRNGEKLLRRCVDSVTGKTGYTNYEFIIVDNQSDDPATLEYLNGLQQRDRVSVLHYDHPFNFAAINNTAAARAKGDLLCLMNDDIEVISPDWLGEMVSHAVREGIGAVGACLWYPDDRLQHGGVVLGPGGVAGHAFKYLQRGDRGYMGRAVLVQNYSAVTAACLLVKKSIFDEIEGFDEQHLAVAFNDVDLCLRIQEAGYRNLWTPYAELYHYESASRGYEDTGEKKQRFSKEVQYMLNRWGPLLERDPAYNPNLSRLCEDFSLNWKGVI